MFDDQTDWTDEPCHYVVAYDGGRRAWLAGPYRTRAEADRAVPAAVRWALQNSGDGWAERYRYDVHEHFDGHVRAILGEAVA